MDGILIPIAALIWVGGTLALSEIRWFARRPLEERLWAYVPGSMGTPAAGGLLSVQSFREAMGPLARGIGAQVSRLVGISEDLDRRLQRIHASLDVTEFRVRQVGWSMGGFGGGALLSAAIRPPAIAGVLFALGGLLLAYLVLEQQVTAASDRWKRNVRLELAVTAEQIGMLLASGFSLFAALDRIATRGQGVIARDMRRVVDRVRQGVGEHVALQEWAQVVDVPEVDRLVAVLGLHREASDLGSLIAAEARSIRRAMQRDLVTVIERRGQQVWIPVTVATLVPGAIFIGVPFTAALGEFLG